MAENQRWQAIPTQLDRAAFEQFVLPHLSPGSRGPAPTLGLHKIFNYVLKHLYLGCQWKELAIDKDGEGFVEIHYTRICRIWRRWVDNGCIDAIFAGSVLRLHQDGLLDTTVIHGDGTTTAAAKKGRRQPRLQWAQEGEGRQGRRLLRSPLHRDRAVRGGAGHSKRTAAA
ncbi:MAG: hypothetical protein QOF70_7804, partial [Acetobacteraceae bacterium]|nr:hypothetical protein [Acetobacteraceae bacterium]